MPAIWSHGSRKSTPASKARSEPWLAGPDVAHPGAFVLVVDDDSVNRLLLSRSLEREGHRFAIAEIGCRIFQIPSTEFLVVNLHDVEIKLSEGIEMISQKP